MRVKDLAARGIAASALHHRPNRWSRLTRPATIKSNNIISIRPHIQDLITATFKVVTAALRCSELIRVSCLHGVCVACCVPARCTRRVALWLIAVGHHRVGASRPHFPLLSSTSDGDANVVVAALSA